MLHPRGVPLQATRLAAPTHPPWSRHAYNLTPSTARPLSTPGPLARPAASDPSSHHDLASFLTYARQAPLSPASTLYVGTHYEYTVLHALARLGFTLRRTGGAHDRGVDLRGLWCLPQLPPGKGLDVVVQCKALKKKLSPAVVRELEGTAGMGSGAARAAGGRQEEGEAGGYGGEMAGRMAVLATPHAATKGVREAMAGSAAAMAFVKISAVEGRVEQLLWNRTAAQMGLDGLGVVVRHIPGVGTAEAPVKEIVLTWKGEAWEADGTGGGMTGCKDAGAEGGGEEKHVSPKD